MAGHQDECINVLATNTDNLSSHDMLTWINDCLQSEYRRIEGLSDGAAYAQLMDLVFPGTVPLKEVNFNADSEDDRVHNFKIVCTALKKVGCNKEVLVKELVRSRHPVNIEFLQWFKKFFDANYDGHEYNALKARDNIFLGSSLEKSSDSNYSENSNKQLVALTSLTRSDVENEEVSIYNNDEYEEKFNFDLSLINYSWSKKILELVGNKAILMESFSWLSTVGGGYSALGENDTEFSSRAGALSLRQQLYLAELLNDDRLKVMCHIFAALAALQLDYKRFCINYVKTVIIPLLKKLPYRDPVLVNMVKHICFRTIKLDRFVGVSAIKDRNRKIGGKRY